MLKIVNDNGDVLLHIGEPQEVDEREHFRAKILAFPAVSENRLWVVNTIAGRVVGRTTNLRERP